MRAKIISNEMQWLKLEVEDDKSIELDFYIPRDKYEETKNNENYAVAHFIKLDKDFANYIIGLWETKDYEFEEYAYAIQDLFQIAYFVEYSDLQNQYYWPKLEHFLRLAGDENDGPGVSYASFDVISMNAGYLSKEYVEGILKYVDRRDEDGFYNILRSKVIKKLLDSVNLDDDIDKDIGIDNTMNLYKFRYNDSYKWYRSLDSMITKFVAKYYPQYVYKEFDQSLCQIITGCRYIYEHDKRYIVFTMFVTNGIFTVTLNYIDTDLNNINMLEYEKNKKCIVDISINYEYDKSLCLRIGSKEWAEIEYSENIDYDYEDWDSNIINQKKEIIENTVENILQKDVNNIIHNDVYKEEFKLVYFEAAGLYGTDEKRILRFVDDIDVELNNGELSISYNTDKVPMPVNFFGEYVNDVFAVIGQNGSGKSSIFKMISSNPIFSGMDKSEYSQRWGDYIIIYKLGANYYYSTSVEDIKFSVNSEITIIERNALVNTNICLIANSFDINKINTDNDDKSSDEHFSNYIDLSTSYIIDKNSMEDYKITEANRINQLKTYMKEKDITLIDYGLNDSDVGLLSSGQYARWSLFARILYLFDGNEMNVNQKIISKRDYILLLDEAELYMHPEWQRKLVYDVIHFLEEINKNGVYFENITVMFSSNSPFLMSDLPNNKICLFSKDSFENKCTFGQNIYEILRDKFFMPELAMGKLAEDKINKALKINAESNEDDINNAKYVASIIGDPFIKDVLDRKIKNV